MDFDNSWDALLKPWKTDRYFDVGVRPAFDPAADDYSASNAWWLAELARLVYRDGGRHEALAEVGLREIEFVEEASTQGMLVCSETFAAMVFRGTSQLRDWVTNLRAVPARWPGGGRVHRGFRRALQAIWRSVGDALDRVDVPVFYTGHSLGGALATLAASLRPPRATYTFGAPRVGDGGFAATLSGGRVFRIVNQRDVVPTVPPAGEILRFRHAGESCRIVAAGRMLRGRAAGQAAHDAAPPADLPDACDERRWFDPAPFLADHAPVNYVAHLERLLLPR